MLKLAILSLGVVLAFGFLLRQAEPCNEAVCGSIVSKCLLTQACKCSLKNCTCCKDCFNCLNHMYTECCSCVDMCPKRNETNSLGTKSHVEDFPEPIPSLFNVLTEETVERKWNVTVFPIDIDLSQFSPKKELKYKIQMQSAEQEVVPMKSNVITLNCTVAFMWNCMSSSKCKDTCSSMGASSYRWFHDSCCECVGENCLNYGINESRCLACPEKGELVEDPADELLDEDAYNFDHEMN